MIIADLKDITISSFNLWVAKLWSKEDDGLYTDHP